MAVIPPTDAAVMETEDAAQISVVSVADVPLEDVPVEGGPTSLHQDPGAPTALHSSSLGGEEDSGCWHCTPRPQDGEQGYRNAYCTLSDHQDPPDHQDPLDPPEQQGSTVEHSDPEGFLRRVAVGYLNLNQNPDQDAARLLLVSSSSSS